MLQQKSEEIFKSEKFKKFFLLEFTKQLINHSAPREVLELKIKLKEHQEDEQQRIKQIIEEKEQIMKENIPTNQIPLLTQKTKIKPFFPRKLPASQIPSKNVLRIPETKLPERLQYLKPFPTNIQIDLGKLNPLVNDPMVQLIECNGADEKIIVKGVRGTKKTEIILTKEDIDHIIDVFSKAAKIPAEEGIFKVVRGKLIFSAIISKIVGSKFVIKKMTPERTMYRR